MHGKQIRHGKACRPGMKSKRSIRRRRIIASGVTMGRRETSLAVTRDRRPSRAEEPKFWVEYRPLPQELRRKPVVRANPAVSLLEGRINTLGTIHSLYWATAVPNIDLLQFGTRSFFGETRCPHCHHLGINNQKWVPGTTGGSWNIVECATCNALFVTS